MYCSQTGRLAGSEMQAAVPVMFSAVELGEKLDQARDSSVLVYK